MAVAAGIGSSYLVASVPAFVYHAVGLVDVRRDRMPKRASRAVVNVR